MPDGGYDQIKALLEQQGQAFEAFKETHAEELKRSDAVTQEKLEKIETSLDAAVEAKAKIETALEAERKEREELEARLNRVSLNGGKDAGKAEEELKSFNQVLASNARERSRPPVALDEKGIADYRQAQERFLREGKEALSETEIKTLSVGSDPDGGYYVTPDMTGRIARFVYETSPMRQIANVQSISTGSLQGIEDLDEAGAGYAGEQTQGSDTTTPQVGRWEILTYWIDTEPKATQQLLDDASVNIEAWLSQKVADKFARFENAEFVTGSTGKIRGLTSYTTAADSGSGVTWGTIGHVVTGANGALASSNPLDKFHDLMGALKQAYLMNARWLTRRSVITLIRKVKDGEGNYIWQPSFVAGQPETIMAYPVTRAEDMPAIATGSLSLGFGDFMTGYQIVDRQGIRVMRDPYTSKPFIKFYTTKRTGGGVVNFESFKLLKFSAT